MEDVEMEDVEIEDVEMDGRQNEETDLFNFRKAELSD